MVSSRKIEYSGPLSEILAEFIAFKKGSGLNYDRPEFDLMAFSRFTVEHGLTGCSLPKSIVEQWCSRREGESIGGWQYRATEIRQLAVFMQANGQTVHFPQKISKQAPAYIPYIFSQEEIISIINVTDNLGLSRNSDSNHIMPILMRVLFGCGLRISEACNLLAEDVDLTKGYLYIRSGKNDKDRIVPMDASLIAICRQYYERRESTCVRYFFETKQHKPPDKSTCYKLFRRILFRCGISHGGRGKGPRLHDTRHTFAVWSLKSLVDQGLDIYTSLPILSTYLGHESVIETEKYVRLTSPMFPELSSIISASTNHVVPEVLNG